MSDHRGFLHLAEIPETDRQRASRKRNPLRRLYSQTGIAITIAGKLHRGESLRVNGCFDEKAWFRKGAEAARLLWRSWSSNWRPANVGATETGSLFAAVILMFIGIAIGAVEPRRWTTPSSGPVS